MPSLHVWSNFYRILSRKILHFHYVEKFYKKNSRKRPVQIVQGKWSSAQPFCLRKKPEGSLLEDLKPHVVRAL